MTTFNFSTGNPANLTGGGGANMTDIGGSFTDVKSFINGGSMDETNVPNLAAAFTSNKPWLHVGGAFVGGGGNNTFLLSAVTLNSTPPIGGANGSSALAVRFNPVDFNANSRVTKIFMRAFAQASTTSPALASVTVFMAAANMNALASSVSATVGTIVPSSTLTFSTVNASYLNEQTVEFNAPAAGYYVIATQMSTLAASSYLQLVVDVMVHQT